MEYPLNTNHNTWPGVTCKDAVRRLAKALDPALVEAVSVARTGTVYIRAGGLDIRLSDHESAAGKWSFDGRTETYTHPHIDLPRNIDAAVVDTVVQAVEACAAGDEDKALDLGETATHLARDKVAARARAAFEKKIEAHRAERERRDAASGEARRQEGLRRATLVAAAPPEAQERHAALKARLEEPTCNGRERKKVREKLRVLYRSLEEGADNPSSTTHTPSGRGRGLVGRASSVAPGVATTDPEAETVPSSQRAKRRNRGMER